ncbi:signal peptide protein [Cryptosporidium sp. chipmunk genotype I]|uniref:signal peptide protein n=1 Tax=Cryptosporidium sp. chipmunk genotype I TaxID=1280935 RepID=UPI00351A1A9F|nr:signal peptide protein [Cryptosporidium sp. chipmunk genotype I]
MEFKCEKYNEFSLLQMSIPRRMPVLFRSFQRALKGPSKIQNIIDFSSFDGTLPRQKDLSTRNSQIGHPNLRYPPSLPKKNPVGDPYNPESTRTLLSHKLNGL